MSYSNGLGNLKNLIGNVATNAAQSAQETANTKAATKTSTGSTTGPHDGTKLSGASNLFSKALSGSDVRTEKVAAIQQSIANGTYSVSAGDVAASIIGSLLN